MASYDVRSGLSGAASGAATGSAIAPGIGTAIGAGVGLLSGFLGGDEEDNIRERAIREGRESLRSLVERRDAALERTPTETPLFEAGAGILREQQRRGARRDAQAAAARGLQGSQFEIAQDKSRAQATARGLRSLVRDASRADRQRERFLGEQVHRRRSALHALVSDEARGERRRDQRQNRLLFETVAQAAPVLAETDFSGLFGGDGGSDSTALDAIVDPPGAFGSQRFA